MLLYNVIVAALLAYSGAAFGLAGFARWPADAVHTLLAHGCGASWGNATGASRTALRRRKVIDSEHRSPARNSWNLGKGNKAANPPRLGRSHPFRCSSLRAA